MNQKDAIKVLARHESAHCPIPLSFMREVIEPMSTVYIKDGNDYAIVPIDGRYQVIIVGTIIWLHGVKRGDIADINIFGVTDTFKQAYEQVLYVIRVDNALDEED